MMFSPHSTGEGFNDSSDRKIVINTSVGIKPEANGVSVLNNVKRIKRKEPTVTNTFHYVETPETQIKQ